MQNYQNLLGHDFDEWVTVTLPSFRIFEYGDPQFALLLSRFLRTTIAIYDGVSVELVNSDILNQRELFKHDRDCHVMEDPS